MNTLIILGSRRDLPSRHESPSSAGTLAAAKSRRSFSSLTLLTLCCDLLGQAQEDLAPRAVRDLGRVTPLLHDEDDVIRRKRLARAILKGFAVPSVRDG
jgi:hypothetical protein